MNNVQKIVDQFDMYLHRGIYDDWKLNDKFLRFVLDHSKTPSFQGRKTVKICPHTGKQYTTQAKIKPEYLTPEQEKELREVMSMMDGYEREKYDKYGRDTRRWDNAPYLTDERYVDHARWTSADELYARITKVPPDMQESILVLGIMIYLLRVVDIDFNSDTATFGEFYENYHQLVLASHRIFEEK